VTVNDDNSWAGEFKAFQYDTYEEGKPHNAGPIQIMDRFRTGQMSNGSQVVVELASSSAEKAAEKPAAMQPGFEGFLAIMGLSVMGYLSLVRKQ
jgi:hypothetical protein